MFLLFLAAAASPTVATAAQPTAAEDKIVCRRPQTFDTGSHMRPKKICMKASEWDYAEQQTKKELQSMRDRGIDPGHADAPR